jgi:hypothetical protein
LGFRRQRDVLEPIDPQALPYLDHPRFEQHQSALLVHDPLEFLACSTITDYRSTYASAIKKVVSDGYLSRAAYSTFANAFAGSTLTKELSQVASTWPAKRA